MTAPDAAVTRIVGALVEVRPSDAALYEVAFVGERRLIAEVVRRTRDTATLQVYEDTTGLRVGERVAFTGGTLDARLGPGLLGSILDGIGRPLERIAAGAADGGDFIRPGTVADMLDSAVRWAFTASARPGDAVQPGERLGVVREGVRDHPILVPPGVGGRIARLDSGEFTVADVVGTLEDGTPLRLAHRWPIRLPRPVGERLAGDRPFVTGQRVFDLFYPVAEGGSAAVPGGFGTGKTIIEQSLAKHSEADVVVYVGCGERGNEMTDLLNEFPALVDPRTGRSLMERSVLIVNTSNMPVAAREASIYLGVTIAEYFRDHGQRVALMVDSTSRWAESLREMSARLQEMPGEEGYPTYLASRLAQFFERAGRVRVLGSLGEGSVSIVAAISPAGGDFSEPVTQASLRVSGALWALDPALAHQRHFPAVDWETSYSLYAEQVSAWFTQNGGSEWSGVRRDLMRLLQRERELRDIAGLVGPDALEDADRLAMDWAALVREVVLRQNAYDPGDERATPRGTYALAARAVALYASLSAALHGGTPYGALDVEASRRELAAVKARSS
ncbi:MAG TPA: V-type ATP synthase subunit A [Gemmatimonadaceae bacterium]|nr:V-type ATP synthase subunit A [Gemmatimonadaceae bacterium]